MDKNIAQIHFFNILIYIYICVCVCMCILLIDKSSKYKMSLFNKNV